MLTKTQQPKQQKFNGQLRLYISQAITEILNDPDYGMELSEKTKERLQKIKQSPRKAISFEDIKKKYL